MKKYFNNYTNQWLKSSNEEKYMQDLKIILELQISLKWDHSLSSKNWGVTCLLYLTDVFARYVWVALKNGQNKYLLCLET